MALQLFLSYSTKDADKAKAVADRLMAEQHQVFFAETSLRIGSPISATLQQQIRGCDVFVVLWSANAAASEWVSQEIGIAKGAGRVTLPVILEAGLTPPGFIRDDKFLPAYEAFAPALEHLSREVRHHADEKQKATGLALLGLSALILFALSD